MSSRIPVYQENRQPEITNPKATGRIAENMKRTKCEFKETTIPSNFNFALKTDSAGILKPHNNVPRKKFTATTYKGPSSRLETELRDQKRLLEAFNGDLQKNLLQSKEKVDLLEQQYRDLQGEKNEIQKQLESCLHLLVAGNIDLDLGEELAETAQQKEEQRKEVQSVSQELMGELQTFGQKVSEHRAQVQQVQERMRDLREKREQHLEEREAFSLEVEEMEKALEQAEQLLVEM
ncbi:small kinetochore-associated protein [Anguilla rostrata]|uniref:small kinetochore-associated protein n=1 Tax=Anguilla anguilla TaxID=7936 RepID=UPI0015A9F800|nr:small kinetochore-associated protein [Anguilla anguilla]